MIVHNFDPVFIDLGLIEIRWYSIAYILGIVLGWIYANKIINTLLALLGVFFILVLVIKG